MWFPFVTLELILFSLIIDDNMTILMAFQTPEVEVIGLATIFGNVTTKDATRNALLLVCFLF